MTRRPRHGNGVDRAVALCCLGDRLVLAEAASARGRPRLTALAEVAVPADTAGSGSGAGAGAAGGAGAAAGGAAASLPLLVERHGWRGRRAVLVLESEHTVARFWKAPDLPARDQLACLALEAEKWLPGAEWPWLGLCARTPAPAAAGEGPAALRDEENALAVAVPADTVAALLRAVAAAGLEPWGVTVPPLAFESTLAGVAGRPDHIAVAIHLGAQKSWLAVARGGALLMVRELDVARDGLLAALALIPVEGHGNVRLAPEEASALLDRLGVVLDDEPIGMATERIPLESFKYALRPALERLASSIGRSLDFCREQCFIEIPETLHLTGAGARVPGLDAWLSAHLLARIERGLPWQGWVDLSGADAAAWDAQPELAAVAAGAAVGALRGRALPARARQYGLPRWVNLPARRLAAAAVGVAALAWAAVGLQAGRAEHDAARWSAERAALTARLEAAQATARGWDATRLEQALAARHERGQIRVDGILKALSLAVPPGVTLSELDLPGLNGGLLDLGGAVVETASASAGAAGGLAGGGGVAAAGGAGAPGGLPREDGVLTLKGEVRTDRERLETALSRLIVQLEQSPYFDNVIFVGSAEEDEGTSSFRLRCRIHQGLRPAGQTRVVAVR